ncbi:MAG: 50S ribosomal protein L21 [Holosporales bacterium]|jgi:large subunit ribosomal protein L21|nr:50S ribosomal protein L21 [Holosporales bacterium]
MVHFMIAVLKTGGKQYVVKPGDVLKVEKIAAEPEAIVSLTDVVMVQQDDGKVITGKDLTGTEVVTAEVLRHTKNRKVIVFKKRRRHNSRRKNGHRQWATVLKVASVTGGQAS